MRKLLVAAALALVPVASSAQLGFGLRVGYAAATGHSYGALVDADTGAPIHAGIFDLESQIPIQLDATYEVTPGLAVGAYVSYGFGQLSDEALDGACLPSSGFDCSATVVRLGAQGIYSFRTLSPRIVPWAGLGFGYEWASMEARPASGDARALEVDMSGFELVHLQLGADYVLGERVAIGPYVACGFGRYGDPSGMDQLKGLAVTEHAVHAWLSFGVRGSLGL